MNKMFKPKDIVRISSLGTTGVVNRVCHKTGAISVFPKGHEYAVWLFPSDLKRIGSTKRKGK